MASALAADRASSAAAAAEKRSSRTTTMTIRRTMGRTTPGSGAARDATVLWGRAATREATRTPVLTRAVRTQATAVLSTMAADSTTADPAEATWSKLSTARRGLS